MLRLLSDISKTLVTVQPLEQVLARVVDLVFDALPAERAFLLLRDSWDQPLAARVLRCRDGSVPANVSISRMVVSHAIRDASPSSQRTRDTTRASTPRAAFRR